MTAKDYPQRQSSTGYRVELDSHQTPRKTDDLIIGWRVRPQRSKGSNDDLRLRRWCAGTADSLSAGRGRESPRCRPFPDLSLRGNRFVESTDPGAAGRPCGDRPPLRIAATAAYAVQARQPYDAVALNLSGGSTVRTRVTNTSNAAMKSRKNCSVDFAVTSPTSVIRSGVNWM
jgi:hypothetical protein